MLEFFAGIQIWNRNLKGVAIFLLLKSNLSPKAVCPFQDLLEYEHGEVSSFLDPFLKPSLALPIKEAHGNHMQTEEKFY